MIVGIGVDIIEVDRIEKAAGNPRFLKKCFTDAELELFQKRGAESVAGNFAAKEAVAKAFGTGFSGMDIRDIEILRDANGSPEVRLYGEALRRSEALCVTRIHASISHCVMYAVAYVIAEKGEPE